jgi:hypothetical protein
VGGNSEQELKNDSLMYVSVETTLRQELRWKKSWDEMYDVDDFDELELSSWFSGTNFRSIYNQLKCDMGDTAFYPVAIQVYYDDFEPCDPPSSKACLHKLGGFYLTLLNLKRKFNSTLDSRHLLALAIRLDIAKYGMPKILEPLQLEVSRLENGFDVHVENGRNAPCCLFALEYGSTELGIARNF